MPTAPAHHTWQPSLPVPDLGGAVGRRTSGDRLGPRHALRTARHARRGGGARTAAASPSSSSRSRRCRVVRSRTASSPISCTQLGVDIDDVDLADFRRVTAPLARDHRHHRSDPGARADPPVPGRAARAPHVPWSPRWWRRWSRCSPPRAARPGSRGCCRSGSVSARWSGSGSRSRCGTPVAFVAVMVVATAGALTWGFVGDTHGDAAWIVVLALAVGHRVARSSSSS